MADPFATGLRALFRAPGSVATVYTPFGGEPSSPRGIRAQPTEELRLGATTIPVDTHLIQYQRCDVAAPQAGEQVLIGDEAFLIDGEPRLDLEGLSWTCELVPV